jgi:hypothetical protein
MGEDCTDQGFIKHNFGYLMDILSHYSQQWDMGLISQF